MDQNNIPKSIIEFSNSPELFDISENIGNKFDLHINQIGELDAQIREVLRGKAKSEDFVKDLMEYLEIEKEKADEIARVVNTEVFQTLRTKMQQTPRSEATNTTSNISSIEKAGNFQIERENEPHTIGTGTNFGGYSKTSRINLLDDESIKSESVVPVPKMQNPIGTSSAVPNNTQQPERREPPVIQPIIRSQPGKDDIEPEPEIRSTTPQHIVEPPINLPGQEEVIGMTDVHTDALVDHLLGKVANAIQDQLLKKEPTKLTVRATPVAKPEVKHVPGVDPYLESFK